MWVEVAEHIIVPGECTMDTHRADDPDGLEPDDLSRREVLRRIGAGGLAVALAAQAVETAHAQEATPAAVGPVGDVSGMPEGVNLIPLGGFPVHDLPTEPFTIRMVRVTLEPGAVVPPAAVPYPAAAYIEAGEGVICPEGGEGRWLYGPDGELLDWGTMEMVFPVGTWCYTSPNTVDGLRNDGTDRASVLGIELVPTTE
jgi:quercetin dioxygenase-like cupin family protein